MQGLLTKTSTLCKAIVTVEGDEARGFGRINLKSIKVGQKIPFDLYLKSLSDCRTRSNYLLGCSRNTTFHEAWAQKLADMGIQWVYFAAQDQNLVLGYLASSFRDTLRDERLEPLDRVVLIHDTLYIWMHIFFATERQRTGPLIKLALTLVDDLVGLVDDDDNFSEFFVNISRHGELLYSHSLNVALMSLAFSRYLAWPREDAISFGLGGLLHDIGMIRIPREIIEKPVALTPEEETLVHKHPQDGYNFLMTLPNIRKEIMLMTLQHHENGDGSGYPWGLPMKEIHKWARLLRIIDSYESVTSGRPWRAPMSPSSALWQMKSEWQLTHAYDLVMLKPFIKFMAGFQESAANPSPPAAFSF